MLYPKALVSLSRQCLNKREEIMKAMVHQSCSFSVTFSIRLSNLKQTWNRWAHRHLSCYWSYSTVSSAPPAQTRDACCVTARSALKSQLGTGKDRDDVKAASLLPLKKKALFAVSSVEEGGKQTLQRAFSAWQGTVNATDFCITLYIGFHKKGLGLRLASTLPALKAKA